MRWETALIGRIRRVRGCRRASEPTNRPCVGLRLACSDGMGASPSSRHQMRWGPGARGSGSSLRRHRCAKVEMGYVTTW